MNIQTIVKYIFLLAGTSLFAPLFAQNPKIDIQSSVAWDKQQVEAAVSLNLASAEIIFPSGRARAEEILDTEFPRLVQESLFSILIDSSSTIADLINRNEYSLHDLSNIALSAQKIPPALSLDMQSITSRYTINLSNIRSNLVKHKTTANAAQILIPVPSRAYTGIVIFANTEMTVHGRQSKAFPLPCVFPKIWDSQMNLIFEKNMVQPETAKSQGIVKYADINAVFKETPSGMDEELIKIVGENPLRIIAQGIFGSNPTDPIINQDDALIIISNEENRKLLHEGRIVIILDNNVIQKDLTPNEE